MTLYYQISGDSYKDTIVIFEISLRRKDFTVYSANLFHVIINSN